MSKSADAFRTISEVAEWLGVQTHVLRFWESKFAQVKPVKRAGGRRYYRPSDMLLLGGIRRLLHEDGLTIKGVQKILREEGIAHVADMSHPLDDYTSAQLDADLADHTGADVSDALESTPAPSDLDHAPEHSRPAPPTPPADDDAVDAAEGLPSFMRTSAPDAAPDAPMAAQTEDAPETGIDSPDMGDMDAPIQFSDMAPDLTPELASDLPSDFVSDFFSESPSETALDTSPEINADPGAFDDTPAEDVPSPAPDAPEDPTPPQSIPETMFEDFAPKPAEDNSTQERPEVAQVPEVFDTAAQTPISFDFDAPVEDTPPVPEPALMDAPAAEKPDAPEPVQDAPAPMFSRAATPAVEPDLDTAPLAAPPSEVEPEAEPIFDAPPIAPEPEATAQPEPEPETAQFAPEPEAAAEPEAAPLPEIDAAPPAPEPEPEPAAPPPLRPRIIDVPDDDGLNSADFAPSVLTKAAKLRQLTPAQRDQMRPLIAQLTALRDQMAQARHEQR